MSKKLQRLKQKIGQRLIVGFDGTTVPQELVRLDEEWGLGGYILFKRNLSHVDQIFDLNEGLMNLGQGIPPFIGIDAEGGKVNRLPEGFTRFVSMSRVGREKSVSVAYEIGAIISRELSAAGFNLNFAPVLDIQSSSSAIGDRAISNDPEVIATLAKALIQGFHDNNIIACGKHFPGHHTNEDSHNVRPKSTRDRTHLLQNDLIPYQKLIHEGPRLDMVMTAHIIYTKLDKKRPATLSMEVIQDLLRSELGFRGVVCSDDLEMKAITNHHSMEEVATLGLEAGLDIFLVCHSLDAQVEILETLLKQAESGALPLSVWEHNYDRILNLKRRHFRRIRQIDRGFAREQIGSRDHQRIAARLQD